MPNGKWMNVHGFIGPSRVLGVLFLLIAMANAGLAIWFYVSTASFVRHAVCTKGTVVRMMRNGGKGGSNAVIEFTDSTGTTHQMTNSWSSDPPAYVVGQTVNVFYDPANPNKVKIDGFVELWLTALIFTILTIPAAVVALLFLLLIPFTIRRVWPNSRTVQPPPIPHL
jgi:hypothetical protein